MNTKDFFARYGAYLVAAVLFIALGYIYCSPVLSGKHVVAADNVNGYAALLEEVRYTEQTGDQSWWNGSMFGGMPNYQIGGASYSSAKWLSPFTSLLHKGTQNPAWVFIFYFLSFFILLRSFDVDKWLSIVGAIAIALSSYFIVIIAAGHGGKTIAIAYTSIVVGGFYLIFRKKYIVGAIFSMFFTAMGAMIHPQMAYYIFLMIGLLWIAELAIHIREKRWKDLILGTLIFAAAVGIGLGTGCANVFANAEYAEQTMRGGQSDLTAEGEQTGGLSLDYATQWSYGIDESMSFLIPGFMGGANSVDVGTNSTLYKTLVQKGVVPATAKEFCASAPMYWGEQPFTAGNVYMGAIVCFLFLLGLLLVKGPYKWALLAATLFSAALALGHNWMGLTEFFFKYFPMYSKFRAVSSILVVAEIAMPLLGFLALKAIMDGALPREQVFRGIYWSAGITGGLCLLFALLGGSFFSFTSSYDASWAGSLPDWVYAAILDQRAALLRSDSFRSFLFIAGAALVVWLYAAGKLKEVWLVALLGVLILADMWPVDKRYFNNASFSRASVTQVDMLPYEKALLEQDPTNYRVMNLTTSTFNDARTSAYLRSVGGYSAVKLRRYQDLIDEHLAQLHMPVLGMLNTKYFITAGEDGQSVVQFNPDAMGNAWFVSDLQVVDDARAESDALMQVDLHETAVLDREFAAFAAEPHPAKPADATVVLTDWSPKDLDYTYSTSAPGTIVFSEIYYPYGWKATIDGQSVDHFRVNYMLRALNVPAGQHTIHFTFDPESIRKGDAISVFFCVLMYLLCVGLIGLSIYWARARK